MLDVVTIGSATWDIFLKSDQFVIDRRRSGVYLCEKYEKKTEVEEIVMVSGGGGTNNAVSYCRKGLRAAAMVEMGKDPAAAMILSDLKREKVDLSFIIQEEDETTAVSVILLSGQGGNSIITYRGASRMLTVSDIPFDELGMRLKPGGWIHLTNTGGNMELVEKVIGWAGKKGRGIFWNPGKVEIGKLKKAPFLNVRKQLLSEVSILQLNRSETIQMFGVDCRDNDIWRSGECPLSAEALAIISDGKRGGRVWSGGKWVSYRAKRVKTVDTTGAGDAFGSGFLTAVISGRDIKNAIELGRRQAAEVAGHIGPKTGLFVAREFEPSKSGKIKMEVKHDGRQ